MASQQHPTTMENLPGEVLSDIFMRLLAKQLAQMRSVCKPWNALLSESAFIKSHLHCSIHNNNKNDGILLFFIGGSDFKFSSFTARPSHSPSRKLTNFIKLPVIPQSTSRSRGGIVGSVNGLICFNYQSYDGDYVVCVWNPSLSAMLTLPPYSSLPAHNPIEIHFGFGFDPTTDDYKRVKITRFQRVLKIATQVVVYSMRKGSWELISERFPSHVTLKSTRDEVCSDGHEGHLHWLGLIDGERVLQTILAFDLGEETFNQIPLPDSLLAYDECCLNVLGVLSGKLCVMSRDKHFKCEVWVMEEYGVAESWVKHHGFSQFGGEITPCGFTKHNEFLFHAGSNSFALYDQFEAKAKTFKIKGGQYGIIKVVEHVDSLVWVAPAKIKGGHLGDAITGSDQKRRFFASYLEALSNA